MAFGELDQHRHDAKQLSAAILDASNKIGIADEHVVSDGGTLGGGARCDPIEAGFGITAELSSPLCDIGAD